MATLEQIENNPVIKEILRDSFGGVLYDVANHDKYDTKKLLEDWEALTPAERECAGGIIKGAINFINQ